MSGVEPFVGYAFQATGAPTRRTMPDRLAEVHNVLDFGADPTSNTDSTTAFNNAINWTTSPNRGTIYIPQGLYWISSPLTINAANISILFRGDGAATTIFGAGTGNIHNPFNGGGAGFIIDRSLGSPSNTGQVFVENISFQCNASLPYTSGCLRLGSCSNATVRNCFFGGGTQLTFEDSPGNSSVGILVENNKFAGGTDGLVIGGGGVVIGNDWVSCNVGMRAYGKGLLYAGNRIERCNTAQLFGLDSGTAAVFNGTVANSSPTLNTNILTVSSIVSGTIKAGMQLSDFLGNVANGVSIDSQIGGTAGGSGTYKLSDPPFVISSSQQMQAIGNYQPTSGFAIQSGSMEGNWVAGDFAGGPMSAFYYSQSHLGHSASNAGAVANIQGTQYGVRVRPNNANNGLFNACSMSGDLNNVAGLDLGTSTTKANLQFLSCTFGKNSSTQPGAVDWIQPSNAYSGWFRFCSLQNPFWTFSQLPTGGNVVEGDQYNVTDINTASWGVSYSGGGSTHGTVRWNGSGWTVLAI